MLLELKGLNSYLGGNLKRTNLEGPELAQLRGTVVKMQGLLDVFRQTHNRLSTVMNYLIQNHIVDENGLYTEWTPCYDYDWMCEKGHWNPQSENKCLSCHRPKQSNSPLWKDRK